MAHPKPEAAPENGVNTPDITPHVINPMTVEQAAEELSAIFENSPTERAIEERDYADQTELAESLKSIELDEKGDLPLNVSSFDSDDVDNFSSDHAYVQDDIHPENDPGDQEREANEHDETDENAAIPAPVSWSKEHREIFDTLPPDAQAVIVERERERDKGFQVKATELATERKQLQALEQQTILERQMYAEALANRVSETLVAPDEGLLDPNSPAYNPAVYYEQKDTFDENAAQLENLQQRALAYSALAEHNNQFAAVEHMRENEDALRRAIPEWQDINQRHMIIDYGTMHGFAPDEVLSASPIEVSILTKAMKFDELMAAKPDVRRSLKRAPRVQKPGAKSRHSNNNRSLAAAKKKLKQTGSVEDAAAVLSHIMKD